MTEIKTTRKFAMPKGGVIGVVGADGKVTLDDEWFKFLGGLEDVSGRVADYVDPSTGTLADVIAALIAAKAMKAE